MKQILCFFIFFAAFLPGTYAQMILSSDYKIRQPFDFISYNRAQIEKHNQVLSEKDIDGTPYLNEEFVKATIFTTSKSKFVDVPVRYNIYHDHIEFKNDEDVVYFISMPEIIEKIHLNDIQLEFINYFSDKIIKKGFFSVVEKGKASLYVKKSITFKGAKQPAPYQAAKNAKYIRKPDEYYIKVDSNPAKKFTRKKDLEHIFTNHTSEIKNFFKKNKIKRNSTESLIKLIKYYNTL